MKPKLLGGGSAEVKRNLFFIYSQMQQMCRMFSQSLAGLMADNEIHQEWESAQSTQLKITLY